MNPDFSNKVVLVTGASAGIGEATALLFAQLGAQLALVGRNADNLRAVAERCQREKGQKPLEIVADLSTDEGAEKTAKDTIEHFGRLDVLVNNAAEGARGLIREADMATFDRAFRTNVRAVYQLTALLVPELIKTKGNIVNISSIAGTAVHTGSLPYSMTKVFAGHRRPLSCWLIRETDMATFDRAFRTNVRAVYQLTALLVPELIKTKGNIVNISSIAGTTVHAGSLPYSMTKAALDHFSRLIALELAPQGVRVNTVSPGITESKFVQRLTGISDESYQQWLQDVSSAIPLGRACSALDIARAIVHLASEHSALVTGALLVIDGAFQFAGPDALANSRKHFEKKE